MCPVSPSSLPGQLVQVARGAFNGARQLRGPHGALSLSPGKGILGRMRLGKVGEMCGCRAWLSPREVEKRGLHPKLQTLQGVKKASECRCGHPAQWGPKEL